MFGGISIWQLLIVLAIIVLIFGTKKLRNMGQDLGGAFKGFKKAVSENEDDREEQPQARDVEFTEVNEEKIARDDRTETVDTGKVKPARTTRARTAQAAAKKTSARKKKPEDISIRGKATARSTRTKNNPTLKKPKS